MEYQVVEGYTTTTLEKNVNKLLADGWELWGGVSVAHRSTYEDNEYSYAQAMVRRKS
jgi:hypothetical protein